jgi:threonine/homoserine/homoserine lactone efflux protein
MSVLIGLIFGFVAAIPLGPVNVFIFSQTIKRDFFHGFMGGLTAAVLDTIYCLIALLGVSQLTFNLDRYFGLPLIKVIAALVLIVLGWRMIQQSKTYKEALPDKKTTSFSPHSILGVVLLYVSNPALYAFWIVVAGTVTSHYWVSETTASSVLFAVSVGIGGLAWYFVLTYYVAKYHHQFKPKTFRVMFLVLAVVLFSIAAYTLLSLFIKLKL